MLKKRKNRRLAYSVLIMFLNIIIYFLMLKHGGIHSLISESFYISAILSGALLGFQAAVINTTAIGFLIGPLQFNQITYISEEEIFYWLFRLLLIVIVGLFVGYIRDKLRDIKHMQKYQEKYLEKK